MQRRRRFAAVELDANALEMEAATANEDAFFAGKDRVTRRAEAAHFKASTYPIGLLLEVSRSHIRAKGLARTNGKRRIAFRLQLYASHDEQIAALFQYGTLHTRRSCGTSALLSPGTRKDRLKIAAQ